jgi:hypothetical protein
MQGESIAITTIPPISPIKKRKKREKKTGLIPKNTTPIKYSVDGIKFFNTKGELDRFLSGKLRKAKKPSPKKNRNRKGNNTSNNLNPLPDVTAQDMNDTTTNSPQTRALTASTTTTAAANKTTKSTEKTLGGNFAPLFFTKEDEEEHNLQILQKAEEARKISDDLFEKTKSALPLTTNSNKFTTDQKQFFPSMGALRKYYHEIEIGKLPELDPKELRKLNRLKKKKEKYNDRLRSAIPSWWTGMPLGEKTEYDACSLPPTPATTIITSSEDEDDLFDRMEEERLLQEEEDRLEYMREWKCPMCWKMNDAGTIEKWNEYINENNIRRMNNEEVLTHIISLCAVCKRPRPKETDVVVTKDVSVDRQSSNSSSNNKTSLNAKYIKPPHQPREIGETKHMKSIAPVSPIKKAGSYGRGPKMDTIGVQIKYTPSRQYISKIVDQVALKKELSPLQYDAFMASLEESEEEEDSDSENKNKEDPAMKLLYETPRIEKPTNVSEPPIMPDVALSPCKEWSLWTPMEMKESNLLLARMIQSYESDFTKLIRVSLCNCRLDPTDATTIAHALRLPSTKIKYLDLSFNYLTGKPNGSGNTFYEFSGFDRLCSAILWSNTLTSLNLSGNALLSSGCRSLAFPIARNCKLIELDVSETSLGLGLGLDNELLQYEDNGGIIEFSHSLVRNTNLRHLRMFGVVLGHVASHHVASGVCTRGTLTTFCDMKISEAILYNKIHKYEITGIKDQSVQYKPDGTIR